MCGIYGFALNENVTIRGLVLRALLKNLTINAQSRGRDATGYAFTSALGVHIFKNNVCADKFIKSKNYRKTVQKYLTSTEVPYSVIGHTRHQTQGSHMNPDNNHPIKTGSIVGVHNGMISNDDEKFTWLSKVTHGEIARIAQVDSEIIFSLINYLSKSFKFTANINDKVMGKIDNPTSKAISETSGHLTGSFACASIDAENPKILWVFRGYGTATILEYKKEGLIIFASTKNIITESVSSLGFSEPEEIELPTFTGICINVETGKHNCFDLLTSQKTKQWGSMG